MPGPASWSVPHARVDWSDGAPRDADCGDIYFSRADGRAESECVFLQGNHLEQRWRSLDPARPGVFVVGETGFGSGLNFLLTQDLFLRTAPPGWQLHYVSVEHRPWTAADLQRGHAAWPELGPAALELRANWPAPLRGPHRLHLSGDRVRLTLLLDEAHAALSGLQAQVHAWFLDGFAPARDAAIWRGEVMTEIARLSAPGATLATYTAAGAVRQALQDSGFTVQRQPGFAGKRHRLEARLSDAAPAVPGPAPADAVVIGAGFAGSACAAALSRRGVATTLLDAHGHPAAGASGVPRAVLYLKLSGAASDVARLQLHALQYAGAAFGQLASPVAACHGVLQLGDAAQYERWANLADVPAALLQRVDPAQASAFAGIPLERGGLWFPTAFTVPGEAWCAATLVASTADFRGGQEVTGLRQRGDAGWELALAGTAVEVLRAGVVIACTGAPTAQAMQVQELPLRPIRGQLTRFRSAAAARPACVITGDGHVIPAGDAELYAGSSYSHDDESLAADPADDLRNRARAATLLGCSDDVLAVTAAWTGLRCAGPDHLPAAGMLDGPPGRYTLTGLRSRGLLFSPLLAEAIASEICGEPLPVTRAQWRALRPSRWQQGSLG